MVSYEFYSTTYNGSAINEDEWALYCTRSESQLQRYKRLFTVTEPEDGAESMAICAMADALCSFDAIANGEAGPIQSSAIGSVSVNYGTSLSSAVDISPKGQEKELYRSACMYLDIYRGLR